MCSDIVVWHRAVLSLQLVKKPSGLTWLERIHPMGSGDFINKTIVVEKLRKWSCGDHACSIYNSATEKIMPPAFKLYTNT